MASHEIEGKQHRKFMDQTEKIFAENKRFTLNGADKSLCSAQDYRWNVMVVEVSCI
jgi:hypothetical protein